MDYNLMNEVGIVQFVIYSKIAALNLIYYLYMSR